jgi:hypothetical protein
VAGRRGCQLGWCLHVFRPQGVPPHSTAALLLQCALLAIAAESRTPLPPPVNRQLRTIQPPPRQPIPTPAPTSSKSSGRRDETTRASPNGLRLPRLPLPPPAPAAPCRRARLAAGFASASAGEACLLLAAAPASPPARVPCRRIYGAAPPRRRKSAGTAPTRSRRPRLLCARAASVLTVTVAGASRGGRQEVVRQRGLRRAGASGSGGGGCAGGGSLGADRGRHRRVRAAALVRLRGESCFGEFSHTTLLANELRSCAT